MRNIQASVPAASKEMVAATVRTIFAEANPEATRAQLSVSSAHETRTRTKVATSAKARQQRTRVFGLRSSRAGSMSPSSNASRVRHQGPRAHRTQILDGGE